MNHQITHCFILDLANKEEELHYMSIIYLNVKISYEYIGYLEIITLEICLHNIFNRKQINFS